jgi:hypothetical protein
MNHYTVTATYQAPQEEVFAYLADIERLPEWATEFARELKRVNGRDKVVNGLGEFFFELRADAGTGVIDMFAGPELENLLCFPTRVVATPAGGSAFTFTMFQAPGQPDEQFERQHASLLREFENLDRRFNKLDRTAVGTSSMIVSR